jgi:hypothetical protein
MQEIPRWFFWGRPKQGKKELPDWLDWFTLFKNNWLSQFYFPGLFSLFLIHTYWGQLKYVEKFDFSRGNFQKLKIL